MPVGDLPCLCSTFNLDKNFIKTKIKVSSDISKFYPCPIPSRHSSSIALLKGVEMGYSLAFTPDSRTLNCKDIKKKKKKRAISMNATKTLPVFILY